MIHTKSKARVKDLGEVFTPSDIANQMIDVLDQKDFIENKFFDPCCGTGNIFIEGLWRRLSLAHEGYYKEKYPHETSLRWSIVYAVATSFAADIMLDNVLECRQRAKTLITDWFNEKMGVPSVHVLSSFGPVFQEIDLNIQHADCLAGLCGDYESAKIAAAKTINSQKFWNQYGWIKIHLGTDEKMEAAK